MFAGSFGLLIKVNVTFRNADQMCMCFVSLIYMCIVCVCVWGSRNKVSPFKRIKKAKKEISYLCLLPRLSLTKYTSVCISVACVVCVYILVIKYDDVKKIGT